LEKHILGWDRGDDLPSEQIPRVYQDFVRCGYADPLVPVFLHNQMDLRGLAGLANRILTLLAEDESIIHDGFELYGLSRMCERRGETNRARKLYEQTLGSELPKEEDRAARASLARIAKRDGDWERARELWQSVLGNSREGYEAYEQLAIYFEHQLRQQHRALAMTNEALSQLRCANQTRMIGSAAYHCTKDKFEHRRDRLQRKLAQAPSKMMLNHKEDSARSLF
jgi:tetratricopeptide (TPR) repeat protein